MSSLYLVCLNASDGKIKFKYDKNQIYITIIFESISATTGCIPNNNLALLLHRKLE